jgi:bacterioferritin (cytochrome b1)
MVTNADVTQKFADNVAKLTKMLDEQSAVRRDFVDKFRSIEEKMDALQKQIDLLNSAKRDGK